MPSSDKKARDCERRSLGPELADPSVGTVRSPPLSPSTEIRYILLGKLTLILLVGVSQLDIDKVDLELTVGLDTDEKRRTTTGGDNLVWEVDRLEDKGEGSFLNVSLSLVSNSPIL
jgi:hypothetical protein